MKKKLSCPPLPYNRILVPVDFSPPSLAALRQAKIIAGGDAKRIEVMHVAEPLHISWRADTTAIQREAHDIARDHLAKCVRDEFGDDAPRTTFTTGNAVDRILRHAAKTRAAVIVLGTHGRTGLKRTFIGSVAERVVRYAPCPVLVVR